MRKSYSLHCSPHSLLVREGMLPGQHLPSLQQLLPQQRQRQTPGFLGLVKQSLLAPSREMSCHWECVPHQGRRGSESAGSMPPNGRGCRSTACCSLGGSGSHKHACSHHLTLQQRLHGSFWSHRGKQAKEEPDWLLEFLSSEIPKLCCQ